MYHKNGIIFNLELFKLQMQMHERDWWISIDLGPGTNHLFFFKKKIYFQQSEKTWYCQVWPYMFSVSAKMLLVPPLLQQFARYWVVRIIGSMHCDNFLFQMSISFKHLLVLLLFFVLIYTLVEYKLLFINFYFMLQK